MPIDIDLFLKTGDIKGCTSEARSRLATLKNITDWELQQGVILQSYAFWLIENQDDFIMLDVEKTCSDEMKQKFLNTDFIYGEYSMSGQGYHLVYRKADIKKACPLLEYCSVIKEFKGDYEILLSHFVTFTGNTIMKKDNPTEDIVRLIQPVLDTVRLSREKRLDVDELSDTEEIYEYDSIMDVLEGLSYDKSPSDFEYDMSRYEFGFVAYYKRQLDSILNNLYDNDDYDDLDKITIVYNAVCEYIEPREKHDRQINGLPYLLHITKRLYEKSN